MPAIRQLTAEDAKLYRDIRLEGLKRHPEAFGASFEIEDSEPLAFFAGRLKTATVFGAFDGPALQGVAGYFASTSAKERHKATLFGMYVRATARGQGIGQSLVESVLEAAAAHYVSIQLTVVTTNQAARQLYERCGFECYGVEPRSLKVDGVYYDEALMYRPLDD